MTASLYRQFDSNGRLLYVGVAKNVDRRQSIHKYKSRWHEQIHTVTTEQFSTRQAALEAEGAAILNEKPVFNRQGSGIKPAMIAIKISAPLKAVIEKAAADDQRSIASLVEKVLSDYLKDKGYLRK